MPVSEGGVRQGWFAGNTLETVVFQEGRRDNAIHISACCLCLLQQWDTKQTHAKHKDRLVAACFHQPCVFLQDPRFQLIPLVFKEGTKLPHFPAFSQQRKQNLKYYSTFPGAGLGSDSAAARTVEYCAHFDIPWGHCYTLAPLQRKQMPESLLFFSFLDQNYRHQRETSSGGWKTDPDPV